MECTQTTWLSDTDYLLQLSQKVVAQRIPLSGSLDLTHRCNLRCVQCYLGDRIKNRDHFNPELTTAQWIDIIDQITDAGCLHLLITGGEPLLRKDFAEIYAHAKTSGMVVTLFTNGTLISDRHIELFKDLPPHSVEISIYGATTGTHEKITGIKGSYEKCLNGIQKLLKHNIHFVLKTILMTHNRHEFYDIKKITEEYGVKFRFDAAIFPTLDRDKTPVTMRVSAKEAIEKEFSDGKMLQFWQDYYKKRNGVSASDSLYHCGAGLTGFHIDPCGNLQPCLMVNQPRYSLLKGNFSTGWQDVMPDIRKRKAGKDFPCNQCEKMALCGYCPAFFDLENQREDILSEYLCAMGQYRFQEIEGNNSQGGRNAC